MEIRKLENNKLHIRGYVNITDKCSRVLRENNLAFKEKVEVGCFKRALSKADDVLFLLNHDMDKKLGSLKDGNLALKEDNIGLYIDAEVENEELLNLYNDGGFSSFSGFSYGFKTIDDSLKEENGTKIRTLKDIDLIEVSLLDSTETPAYYGTLVTSMETRSVEKEIRNFVAEELEEVEETIEDNSKEDNSEELRKLKEYADLIEEVLELI